MKNITELLNESSNNITILYNDEKYSKELYKLCQLYLKIEEKYERDVLSDMLDYFHDEFQLDKTDIKDIVVQAKETIKNYQNYNI